MIPKEIKYNLHYDALALKPLKPGLVLLEDFL